MTPEMAPTASSTDGQPTVPRPTFVEIFREAMTMRAAMGTLVVFVIGLAVISASYARPFHDPTRSWVTFAVRQVGSGLLVAAIASVVLRVFVERYRERLAERLESFLRQDITEDLRSIRENIDGQATLLVTASNTLEALGRAGVARVYAGRAEAVDAIRHDAERPGLRTINIMGISLNDFLRKDQEESLHSVWRVVTSYVKGQRAVEGELAIRVLIIDPNCEGALLRSYGEARTDDQLAGRLDEDVTSTARRLGDLVTESERLVASTRVSFDFRLYRLPPTMLLFSTDIVTYAQTYYFWSRRQFDFSMPLFRLEGTPLHDAMHDHFNLIWDQASVDGLSWLEASAIGIDRGAMEAGVVNLFSSPKAAYDRMCWLLDHAKERVWIQGISLKSFFVHGQLHAALRRAMARSDVDCRLLVLDPISEQAKYRSFREHQFSDHCDLEFTSYLEYCLQETCHAESTLARDTGDTLKKLRSMRDGLVQNARQYSSAPSCFILIADDAALVEQYHYGKDVPEEYLREQGTPPILGKDMALTEYTRTANVLLDDSPPYGSRKSYELLVSHFGFVFERCSRPLIDLTEVTAPSPSSGTTSPGPQDERPRSDR